MSEMTQSFAELFEESLKTIDMKAGSIITGVVVDIDSEWVTVHAGLKSEGVIPRIQFLDESGELEVNIGDAVQVSMDAVDDGFGETRLSREKAKRAESWQMLERVFEELSFTAPDRGGEEISVDSAFVETYLGELSRSTDVSRYVL